jgi:hypothetical protein
LRLRAAGIPQQDYCRAGLRVESILQAVAVDPTQVRSRQVKYCFVPKARDHCTMPPALCVGTFCVSVIRPMLRGGFAAGTCKESC